MIVLEEENKLEERDRALEEIAERLGVRAERGKRFAELTSLRVGGAIDWVIAPDTEEQAAAIVHELDQAGIGWLPLGSGRHTSFKEGELLLGGTLRLQKDDPERIKARMDDAKSKRLSTQPHGSRSAGCFFKNPPASTVGTGKMIDEMGMKGQRRGSAIVSPVHANFIVTEGENARAEDALALAEEIRERVRREQGIELEYEVELWRANPSTDSTEKSSEESVDGLEEGSSKP